MYGILSSELVDGCTAEQALAALVDMPGVSAALGFATGTPLCDIRTGALILGNVKATFEGPLSTNGGRFGGPREKAEAAASAISGPGLNVASVGRVVGISPETLKKGAQLKAVNETVGPSKASPSIKVVREHSIHLIKFTIGSMVLIASKWKLTNKRSEYTKESCLLFQMELQLISTVSIVSDTAPKLSWPSHTCILSSID